MRLIRLLYAKRFSIAVVLLIPVVLASVRGHASAQGPYSARPLAGFRAAQPPVIDGKLDDPLWKSAPKAAAFIDSVTDQPAEEQADAWLAYDDKAIYVAFHCRDSKPQEIVAQEVRHGASMGGDDVVRFIIDPYYTRGQDESNFVVNARGTQREYISGGRAAKREWAGIWQAAAQRVPDGWAAEMRIPWQILPHPHGKRGLRMGINFVRYQARTQIQSIWSSLTRAYRSELIGVWQGIDPPRAARRSPLQWLTYATGEYDGAESDGRPRSGVDLRYTPSEQLNSVVSVFPDFRNVEQAVEGIQFSRTERYLGEARPFFQEGAGYFPGVFYSRRIDTFDLGTKVFGRMDSHLSYGLLTLLRGDQEGDAVGQTSYSLGERGSVSLYGLMGRGGRPRNEHGGLTWQTRQGHWWHGGEWNRARTGSFGGAELGMRTGFEDGRWSFGMGYNDTSPDYAPALGYVGFTNSRSYDVNGGYEAEYRHGPLRYISGFGSASYSARYGGTPYSRSAGGGLSLTTRSNYRFSISKDFGEFEGARDSTYALRVTGATNDRFRRWSLAYQWGVLNDHRSAYWTFSMARRLFRHLDLGLTASLRRDVERREQTIGTVGWEFDARRALTGRLVETDGKVNWYLAFRNSGGLGQELYLILGDPNARRFKNRIALKWVWAG